jgi:hypothetical protein
MSPADPMKNTYQFVKLFQEQTKKSLDRIVERAEKSREMREKNRLPDAK